VGTGEVAGRHYKRRRRLEFIDLMNRMVKRYPGKEIHSTHKPKRNLWLARHPNVHFHYTPTHASWTNQIEIWFFPSDQKIPEGASFGSVPELKDHIDSVIRSSHAHWVYWLRVSGFAGPGIVSDHRKTRATEAWAAGEDHGADAAVAGSHIPSTAGRSMRW
jgi:hypothetical protein